MRTKLFVANISVPSFDPEITVTLVADSEAELDRIVAEHFALCAADGGDTNELRVSYTSAFLNMADSEWTGC